jgi:acetyl esterase/lipase
MPRDTMPSKTLLQTCLLLISTLLTSACQVHYAGHALATPPAEENIRYSLDHEVRDIVYTEVGWPQPLQADLYLPRRAGLIPVVLTIHGGGWANRDRADMAEISERLVEHGYAVLNLDYRFAPRYIFPAQLDDLHQALRWIVVNAERYRLDQERINAWGYSSGAHLAALLGSFDRSGSTPAVRDLPQLRAVVAGGIPADLRKYDDSPIVRRFLGGTPEQVPQRYAEASPAYHVSAGDPAVFLYHGKLDFLVTPDQPEDYYDALLAAGVDAELYLHRWRGHATMFLFGGDAEARAIDFLERINPPG